MTLDLRDVDRARLFAIAAHEAVGQKRKYTNEPYWKHPERVYALLSTYHPGKYALLAAAWLHDVVEDTSVTIETINTEFGSNVSDLVSRLTDVSKPEDGNRAVRKKLDRDHIAAGCFWSHTLKLADMIDNAACIVKHDPKFAPLYMEEKREILKVIGGNKQLHSIAQSIVDTYFYARSNEVRA